MEISERCNSDQLSTWTIYFFESKRIFSKNYVSCTASVGGIMVSIAAFQAVDPGSIPGRRNTFLSRDAAFFWIDDKTRLYDLFNIGIEFSSKKGT